MRYECECECGCGCMLRAPRTMHSPDAALEPLTRPAGPKTHTPPPTSDPSTRNGCSCVRASRVRVRVCVAPDVYKSGRRRKERSGPASRALLLAVRVVLAPAPAAVVLSDAVAVAVASPAPPCASGLPRSVRPLPHHTNAGTHPVPISRQVRRCAPRGSAHSQPSFSGGKLNSLSGTFASSR